MRSRSSVTSVNSKAVGMSEQVLLASGITSDLVAVVSAHISATMLTDDINAGLLAMLACSIGSRPDGMFHLGNCEYGLLWTMVIDMAPMFTLDILEMVFFVGQNIPLLWFYKQLDWFIVVAAVLVAFLNTSLLVWASGFSG
jgi:hypothetical protein